MRMHKNRNGFGTTVASLWSPRSIWTCVLKRSTLGGAAIIQNTIVAFLFSRIHFSIYCKFIRIHILSCDHTTHARWWRFLFTANWDHNHHHETLAVWNHLFLREQNNCTLWMIVDGKKGRKSLLTCHAYDNLWRTFHRYYCFYSHE